MHGYQEMEYIHKIYSRGDLKYELQRPAILLTVLFILCPTVALSVLQNKWRHIKKLFFFGENPKGEGGVSPNPKFLLTEKNSEFFGFLASPDALEVIVVPYSLTHLGKHL